jgi:hypothetical protein
VANQGESVVEKRSGAFCEGSRHWSGLLSVRWDKTFLSRVCDPQVFHNIRRLQV